jgi:hypothetical protein
MELPSKNEQIIEIFSEFDWQRVHKTMIALDWIYRSEGVPSIKKIMNTARTLLERVWKNGGYSATGGFVASKNENGFLNLKFIVSSIDSEEFFK